MFVKFPIRHCTLYMDTYFLNIFLTFKKSGKSTRARGREDRKDVQWRIGNFTNSGNRPGVDFTLRKGMRPERTVTYKRVTHCSGKCSGCLHRWVQVGEGESIGYLTLTLTDTRSPASAYTRLISGQMNCKTFIHRFDSDRRLHHLLSINQYLWS